MCPDPCHKPHYWRCQGVPCHCVCLKQPHPKVCTGNISDGGNAAGLVANPSPKPSQGWAPTAQPGKGALFCFSKWRKETTLSIKTVLMRLPICLPMQGSGVWSLVQEDPTCHRATTPMHLNSWVCALGPLNCQVLSPRAAATEASWQEKTSQLEATMKSSPSLPQSEEACTEQWSPSADKNKIN